MWVQERSALSNRAFSREKKNTSEKPQYLPLWVEYWALIRLIWRPWCPDLGPWLLESVLGSAGNVPWPEMMGPSHVNSSHSGPGCQAAISWTQVTTSNTRVQSLPFPSNLLAIHGISWNPCRPMLIGESGPWRRQCHWTSCKSSELLQRTHDPRKALQTGSLGRIIWPVKPQKRSPEPGGYMGIYKVHKSLLLGFDR